MSSSKSVSIATWRRYIWRIGLPESQISLLLRLPLALTYPNSPEHQVWNIRSRSEWQGWPLTFTLLLSYFHIFTVLLSHFHSPEHQVWHVSSSFGWTGWPRSVGLFLRGEHFYPDSRYSTLLGHFILFGTHHLLMFWTETHDIILQVSQEDNPYLENIIDICSNITQVWCSKNINVLLINALICNTLQCITY